MAVEREFQALMLAEARVKIRTYEAQSHRSIQGRGQPKAMKPPSPRFVKAPVGLDYSPKEFQKRKGKNRWSDSYDDSGDYAKRQVVLDWNNSASGQQHPQRQKQNVPRRQDADQSGYYSEDSELDSPSVTSASVSGANTAREEQSREQDGTFDHHLNQKITLPKLNDDSSTNDCWIWLADVYRYVDSGCLMSALGNEIDRSLSNGF